MPTYASWDVIDKADGLNLSKLSMDTSTTDILINTAMI